MNTKVCSKSLSCADRLMSPKETGCIFEEPLFENELVEDELLEVPESELASSIFPRGPEVMWLSVIANCTTRGF